LREICLTGKVFSGSGEGARFIELSWVKEQISEKLGFIPYLGTLNIRLAESGIYNKGLLRKAKSVDICPTEDFCQGKCFEAYFMGKLKCAIIFPEVADYPEDVIEIIASANLREKFRLKDGDLVNVTIKL